MAVFFTDFSEYSTGSAPADWTARWVTSNVTWSIQDIGGGNHVLRAVVTTTARHAISWDDVGDQDHVEILVKMRRSADVNLVTAQGPVARGSGSATTENGYAALVSDDSGGTDDFILAEYTAGTLNATRLADFETAPNTWYWVRFQLNGSALKLRIWADGGAEPGTWNLEETDATTASGWVGVFAATVATHEFDQYGVGTDGDAAPATRAAAITGTATASINESDVVAGGKEIVITLTGDNWVPSGATFDGIRQDIIDGLDSAQSEATGWNAEVRDNLAVTDVVRTSDSVVTVTLSAQAAYDITATETITVTVPSTAVVGARALTGSPTFTVTPVSAGGSLLLRLQTEGLFAGSGGML